MQKNLKITRHMWMTPYMAHLNVIAFYLVHLFLEWWKVQHMTSNNVGLVPRRYIAEKGTLETEE
jgi:hypothetical protein